MHIKKSDNQRLAHAYILYGNSYELLQKKALELSQEANCLEHDPAKIPCGRCSNCIKLEHDVHRDCFIVNPQGKSQTIQIEQIRQLQINISGKPIEGKMKIVIFNQAHKMNEQSQNCLLKTLEEPPDHTILFLLTDKLSALLPTIQSRCRISTLAGGQAIPSLIEFELAQDILKEINQSGYAGIFDKATFLDKSRKNNLGDFFYALEILFRDGLLKAWSYETEVEPSKITMLNSIQLAPEEIALKGDTQAFSQGLKLVWKAAYLLERNVNSLLLLEVLFLKLSKLNIQCIN